MANLIYDFFISELDALEHSDEEYANCEKILNLLVGKVIDAYVKVNIFRNEDLEKWIVGLLNDFAKDIAKKSKTQPDEIKKQFLNGFGYTYEDHFAETFVNKIREYRKAAKNENDQNFGWCVCDKTILFHGADIFEAAWRTLAGNLDSGKYEEDDDYGNLFGDTDEVMIPNNISAKRLAEVLSTIDLITKKDLHTKESSISACTEYDFLNRKWVQLPTVYYCGKNIFEYCIGELFSQDKKEGAEEFDIRCMFEDKDSITLPVTMTDERLKSIFNALTSNCETEFADTLSVDQYHRAQFFSFEGFEDTQYMSLSELMDLMNKYTVV